MPFHPNPTIRQIAERSGVARATVGFILGGKAHLFRPEMRERVLSAAEELGWTEKPGKQVVRTGRFGCAVLLQSQIIERSVLRPGLLDALEMALLAENMHLTLARLPDEILTSATCVKRLLRQWSADGIFINYTQSVPELLRQQIDSLRVPAVWLNNNDILDAVNPDDERAGYDAAMLLIKQGHRRIWYVDLARPPEWPDSRLHPSVWLRRSGYVRAMTEACMEPVVRHYGRDHQVQLAESWLRAPEQRPSGILGYGPNFLLPLIHAAMKFELKIPGELSFVNFNDEPSWMLNHDVTTFCLPYKDMGESAARHLCQLLTGASSGNLPKLPFILHPGSTVASAY